MGSASRAARRFVFSLSLLMLTVTAAASAAEAEPTADWYCYNEWCCKWIDPDGGDNYSQWVQESCTSCPEIDDGWQGSLGVRPGECY